MSIYGIYEELGQQKIGVDTAQRLTVPEGTAYALMIPEGQAVRFSSTSTPTTSTGYPIAVGVEFEIDIKNIKTASVIGQAAGGSVNVIYVGKPPNS